MTTSEESWQALFEPPERVNYATGVLLDADDFRDEQAYHRGRLARTLAYLHGSGTVAGLKVEWENPLQPGDDPEFPKGRVERLVVQPGVAIDRLGRIIEVPRAYCLRLDHWFESQPPDELQQGLHETGVVADVFIRFAACERGKTPAFVSGPFDALDAVTPARLRDAFQIDLVIRTEADLDANLPKDPWRELANADDPAQLQAAILDGKGWQEQLGRDEQGDLLPLPEHAVGQDATALFLARLVIAASPPTDEQPRPSRPDPVLVEVNNSARAFVYTTSVLRRWLERLTARVLELEN